MRNDERYYDVDVPGVCVVCQDQDEDVQLCTVEDCMTEIHPHAPCGHQCSLCGAYVCHEHIGWYEQERACAPCIVVAHRVDEEDAREAARAKRYGHAA